MSFQDKNMFKHGDVAFGLEDTVRIGNDIYVKNIEALLTLYMILGSRGYELCAYGTKDQICSSQSTVVATSLNERTEEGFTQEMAAGYIECPYLLNIIFDEARQHKYPLDKPDLYQDIIAAAEEDFVLEIYHVSEDYFSDENKAMMSAFFKNFVDYPYEAWEKFLDYSSSFDAQDFIKSLAAWLSANSDNQPRVIPFNYENSVMVTVYPSPDFLHRSLSPKKDGPEPA